MPLPVGWPSGHHGILKDALQLSDLLFGNSLKSKADVEINCFLKDKTRQPTYAHRIEPSGPLPCRH